ncbi:viral sRNA Nucleoprotein [Dashli virus]|uniref:Nucleoprotein n=2 Tax=Phlebovirus TaxID=11584 RepID=A0A288KLD1_9VIRU|nr:viral sRNA Nucleoprotein [Dashli virus]ABQ23534.1 nucleocapsid [Sandfly fever Sicilian virus]ALS88187.1 viral sRNA Nucleoprotein [Dashli virus]
MDEYQKIAVEFGEQAIDETVIQDWLQAFAYQGFDARTIIQNLVQLGGKGWEEDAKKMIILSLTRGNKPKKMVERMSPEGARDVKSLVAKYKIVEGRPGRNGITLSRVAAALAGWTVQAVEVVENFLPVPGSAMDRMCGQAYPRQMMHPSFAGLIDPTLDQEDFNAILDAHKLFLYMFSKTINVNLRGASKRDIEESFSQPMLAAINSSFIDNTQRRAFLTKFGIITSGARATAVVKKIAEVYRKLE